LAEAAKGFSYAVYDFLSSSTTNYTVMLELGLVSARDAMCYLTIIFN